jgi:hypothetical protein
MLSKSFEYQPDDSTYIEKNSLDFDTEFILETTRLKMSNPDLRIWHCELVVWVSALLLH